jgi:hypothetical protein
MAKKIFMWITFLAPVVLVAGIAALIYAFVSDSHYDPNAVVTDSNGFTSRGAYVTNSTWAWVGGIMIAVGMTGLFVGIFGWVFSALWSPAAKALKEVTSALDTELTAMPTLPAVGAATPGWASTAAPPPSPSSPPAPTSQG